MGETCRNGVTRRLRDSLAAWSGVFYRRAPRARSGKRRLVSFSIAAHSVLQYLLPGACKKGVHSVCCYQSLPELLKFEPEPVAMTGALICLPEFALSSVRSSHWYAHAPLYEFTDTIDRSIHVWTASGLAR